MNALKDLVNKLAETKTEIDITDQAETNNLRQIIDVDFKVRINQRKNFLNWLNQEKVTLNHILSDMAEPNLETITKMDLNNAANKLGLMMENYFDDTSNYDIEDVGLVYTQIKAELG